MVLIKLDFLSSQTISKHISVKAGLTSQYKKNKGKKNTLFHFATNRSAQKDQSRLNFNLE